MFVTRRQHDLLIEAYPTWMKWNWSLLRATWSLGGATIRQEKANPDTFRCLKELISSLK